MGKRSRAAVQKPAAAQAAQQCSSPAAHVHASSSKLLSPPTKANNSLMQPIPPTTGHAAAAVAAPPAPAVAAAPAAPQPAAVPQLPHEPAPCAAPGTSTHPTSPTGTRQSIPVNPVNGGPSDVSPASDQPNKKKRKKAGGHHQHQPPVPRDPVSAAVHHFERTYRDVPPERAREALEATQKHAGDLNKWLEAAVEWVARMQEIQDEADEMAAAMAASLQEDQLRRVAEGALWEQPAGALLDRFKQSYILRQVRAAGDPALLLQGAAKRALVELLEQERRCTCQWFPCEGSRAYFRQLGEELRGQLPSGWQLLPPLPPPQPDTAPGAAGNLDDSGAVEQQGQQEQQPAMGTPPGSGEADPGHPAPAEAAAVPAAATTAAAGAQPAAAAPAGDPPPAASASGSASETAAGAPSAESLQQLADLLAAKMAAVVEGVSKMPETPGGMPAIFQLAGTAAAEEDDPDEVVVVVESRAAARQEEVEVLE